MSSSLGAVRGGSCQSHLRLAAFLDSDGGRVYEPGEAMLDPSVIGTLSLIAGQTIDGLELVIDPRTKPLVEALPLLRWNHELAS